VLPDTLPQRFEDTVKGFNTIGCGSLSQGCKGQGSNGPHLLLLVNQPCESKVQNMIINFLIDYHYFLSLAEKR
jgi:hypothetical protein